jgi:cell division transport system ATP-binding protein
MTILLRRPDAGAVDTEPVISMVDVGMTYPNGKVALTDVNVAIPAGDFVFLVGPSGAGKSTFIRLLIREQLPTAGRVVVAGKDVARLRRGQVPQLRRRIGIVFQDFRLLPNKTVHQNVAYALQVLGAPRSRIRSTVPEVLDLVGLAGMEKRFPHQLSGGEQQRVAIARAFVNRPPILLADEPTGNLDPGISLEIVQLLDRINRTGTTVVMATHDFATVDAMRKRVIRLDKGVLVGDVEAGDYTTGSIPRIELDDRPIPARTAEPAVADGYDDGAPDAGRQSAEPQAFEPQGFEPQAAVQGSGR